MYRAAIFALTLLVPSVAAAQQPCTSDARQVVNELYRHMLERNADAGSAHWVQQLESRQATVRDLVGAIAKSPEYQQRFMYTESGENVPYERAVGRLYRHVLGRQPDPEGQRVFARQAQQAGPAAVVDRLLASGEYNQQYGDWGVPGSGGIRYCASGNVSANQGSPQASNIRQRRFRTMDSNNDGRVTRQEWQGSDRSFEVHDWNSDGVLSGRELDAGAARVGRTIEDEDFDRGDEFASLDMNNNGRIEPREWHGSVAAFDRLDVNNDNRLSLAEFRVDGGQAVGTSGQFGQEIRVESRQRWTDSGIDVRAGDLLMIEAAGTIRMATEGDDVATPGGAYSGRRAPQAPMPRQVAGALIGQINGRVFLIGNRRQVEAPSTGRLYLGVNDDHLEDNTGDYQVRVTVR